MRVWDHERADAALGVLEDADGVVVVVHARRGHLAAVGVHRADHGGRRLHRGFVDVRVVHAVVVGLDAREFILALVDWK